MSSKTSSKNYRSKSPKYTSPLRPIDDSSRSSSNHAQQVKFLDILENSLEYLRENKMPPQNSLNIITRVCKKPLNGINIESNYPVYEHLGIIEKLNRYSIIDDLLQKQIILQKFIQREKREKEFDDKLAKVLKEDKSIIVELRSPTFTRNEMNALLERRVAREKRIANKTSNPQKHNITTKSDRIRYGGKSRTKKNRNL